MNSRIRDAAKDSYILITDVGTSLCKTILYDLECKKIAKASYSYETQRPRPLWAQQEPQSWWQALRHTTRSVLKEGNIHASDIAIIGIIGMGHGPVLLDSLGKPITPCLIWPDLRADKEADFLRSKVKELGIEEKIGSRMQGWYTAAKLLWIKENFPDKFKQVHMILLPKDYLQFKLTGNYATDHSDAAGTQLYDGKNHRWIPELLEILQLPPEKLPELRSMSDIAGEVTASAAEETGLAFGTKVMIGANDWETIPMGLGRMDPGDSFIYLGTAPGFRLCTDHEIKGHALFEFGFTCLPHGDLSDRWLLEGPLSAAGGAFTWYIEQFENKTAQEAQELGLFKNLETIASNISAGADGLFFLPHLMGERCPEDPKARAVLYGLSLGHSKAHIARAMHEGIAFALRRAIELAEEHLGVKFMTFRAFGGGSKSLLLTNTLANVLAKRISIPTDDEVGALGLALLASSILEHSNPNLLYERTIGTARKVEPEDGLVKTYEGLYRVYKRIEENMTSTYRYSSN